MGKRIVMCTDGTWSGESNQTNVYRIYKSIPTTADQMAFYDDGVGEDGLLIQKFLGGAFGTGLFAKVKKAYTEVAHVYQAGDEVFLFGFSRGAYTARSVAGMIAACGLPTQNFDDNLVETAFEAYRKKDQRATLLAGLKQRYAMVDSPVKMVGVWDTVGSLGIPAIFGGVGELLYGFLDTTLNAKVQNAYHALAIDEKRAEFPPTLWTGAPAAGQTVEQVWFCGAHSDVGGGAPIGADGTALSDITLAWMMAKASALGLQFNQEVVKKYAIPMDPKYALDDIHMSWNPLWGFPLPRVIDANASIADSVVIRAQHHDQWSPRNLTLVNGAPAGTYKVVPVVGRPAMTAGTGS